MSAPTQSSPAHECLFPVFELCAALGLLPGELDRIAAVLGLGWKAAYTLHERDDLFDTALSLGYLG